MTTGESWTSLIIFAMGVLAFSGLSLLMDLVRSRRENLNGVQPVKPIETDQTTWSEAAQKAVPAAEFDTRKARPLQPAVAAQRFANWMRLNEFTDYIWVGEINDCYLWFCREENYFPVEAKALRELLYQLPGVYWGRPRIAGAAWERFRRQMENWHLERGLQCPIRPVVVRILPCEAMPSVRVREWTEEAHVESGRGPARVRTSADTSKDHSEIGASRRVQSRPAAGSGSRGTALRRVA